MSTLSTPGSHNPGDELAGGPEVTVVVDGARNRKGHVFDAAKPVKLFAFGSTFIAGCLALSAIIVLALLPGDLRPSTGLPKALEHGIAYAIFATFLVTAGLAGWRQTVVSLIILAGILEIGQVWVPGRDSNPV